MEVLRRLLVEPGQSVVSIVYSHQSGWAFTSIGQRQVASMLLGPPDSVTAPLHPLRPRARMCLRRWCHCGAGALLVERPRRNGESAAGRDLAPASILNNLAAARDGATASSFEENAVWRTTICRQVAPSRSTSSGSHHHGQAVSGYRLVEPCVMIDALALCLHQYRNSQGSSKSCTDVVGTSPMEPSMARRVTIDCSAS